MSRNSPSGSESIMRLANWLGKVKGAYVVDVVDLVLVVVVILSVTEVVVLVVEVVDLVVDEVVAPPDGPAVV